MRHQPLLQKIFNIVFVAAIIALMYATTYGWRSTKTSLAVVAVSRDMTLESLKNHIYVLSDQIGWRGPRQYDDLLRAAHYISDYFESLGLEIQFQEFQSQGKTVYNIIAEKKGEEAPEKVIIVGANYDSYYNPGADNNASGMAALLELAGIYSKQAGPCTVRFVAFVNKESAYLGLKEMGSSVYAKYLAGTSEDIKGVFILDSLGRYSNQEHSQRYPPFLGFTYPGKANFIALVGNSKFPDFAKQVEALFTVKASLPVERFIGFDFINSDHLAFWKNGFPAILITDTGSYRGDDYYSLSDTYQTLNYRNIAQIIDGLNYVLRTISR